MDDYLYRLAPLAVLVIGFILKRSGVIEKKAADHLIKINFYVFVPATIFYSLASLELKTDLLVLPAAGFAISLFGYGLGYLLKDRATGDRRTQGSFLIASGSTNQAMFSYPLFLTYLGTEGLSYVAFYDFGQALLGLSLAYYIAILYGADKVETGKFVKKIINFPLLWAFLAGVAVNYFGVYGELGPAMPLIEMLHNCTAPLTMLALGIFLEPRITQKKAMSLIMLMKFVCAPALAFLMVTALGITGLERTTILVAATIPPALITLIYSVEEKLDVDFSAALVSVTTVVGMFLTPLLLTLLV